MKKDNHKKDNMLPFKINKSNNSAFSGQLSCIKQSSNKLVDLSVIRIIFIVIFCHSFSLK